MLWTIFVILLFLWLPGFVSGYAMGGIIHILLVIAIIVLGIDLFRDARYWRDLEPSRRRGGIGGKIRGGQQVQKDFSKSYDPLRDKQNRR